MSPSHVDAQVSLPREVESDAGQHEELGAALHAVLGAEHPDERRDALEPADAALWDRTDRLYCHVRVRPTRLMNAVSIWKPRS